MISRSPDLLIPVKEVVLLYSGVKNNSARIIGEAFLDEGFKVAWLTLGQPLSANQNIVSLLDLEESPFLADISEQSFTSFRNLLSESSPRSILWITRDTKDDPLRGLILGLARTIRLEFSLPFATFEIRALDSNTLKSLIKVELRLHLEPSEDQVPDYEYSVRGHDVSICRYYPDEVNMPPIAETEGLWPKRLRIATCGLMDTLEWVQDEIRAPGEGEVQVEIKYIGLNFKVYSVCPSKSEKKLISNQGYHGCYGIRRTERRSWL
jgi:hypothetical protein